MSVSDTIQGMPLTGRYSDRPTPQEVMRRVWSRVHVTEPDECWLTTWSVGSHGYPQIGWNWPDGSGRTARLVHRVVWESDHGVIPVGMTVDHECRNIRCVNPAHLRLLSNVENARDNGMARRTHCPAGHPYDEANTYVDRRGHRRCRACARERA